MRITTIKYEQVRNLGNFESARVGLEAVVNAGEDAQLAFVELRETVLDMLYDRAPAAVQPEPVVAPFDTSLF